MTELSIEPSMDAVEKREQFRRLPTTVVPQNYNIKLTPNLETFTFLGQLLVIVQVSVLCMSLRAWMWYGACRLEEQKWIVLIRFFCVYLLADIHVVAKIVL